MLWIEFKIPQVCALCVEAGRKTERRKEVVVRSSFFRRSSDKRWLPVTVVHAARYNFPPANHRSSRSNYLKKISRYYSSR